jgi:serine-type D-Ala-D-Ala carboxypeptidase
MPGFPRARQVIDRFVEDRVAPCAVVEVGTADGPTWNAEAGRLTYASESPRVTADTVFDLASLTKVLATATVAMRLVDAGRLRLEAPVADLVSLWRGTDREKATVADLLAHSAGLPGHRPYHETLSGRAQFERAICVEPLDYPPGTASLYSDLGFILLGFVLEDAGGAPLDVQAAGCYSQIAPLAEVRFGVHESWAARLAPTSGDPDRRGHVDDRNAGALAGVAGHAGLFGTARGVGAIARAVLLARSATTVPTRAWSPATVRRFTSRAGTCSSRALGWDTMLATSSCGERMSAQAFGHTGFTGTSLWIDPVAGLYVVLLTNRVYPAPGAPEGIAAFRRALHDAVMADWSAAR